MANFSNNGIDTFDPDNDYIGIRLQQGVPLLDRDWNELEDIRRHVERMLARHYIGEGTPDGGFGITALQPTADNEILIGPGRCLVDGYDLVNRSETAFSEQGEGLLLPPPSPSADQVLVAYLEPVVERVDSSAEPALGNPQDIGMETCVRDRLTWSVKVVEPPAVPPPGTYPLARISRPAGVTAVRAEHIVDLRRQDLTVAGTADRVVAFQAELLELRTRLAQAEDRIERMQLDLDRLFWQVTVTPDLRQTLFGGRARIRIKVTNRRGDPIPGATVSVSTDWGQIALPGSVTDGAGEVTADLVGVRSDVELRANDVARLHSINLKVQAAMVRTSAVDDEIQPIRHASLQFDPGDLELISRYSPTATFTDLTNDLPRLSEVKLPKRRTATVTVHVKESPLESVVKATGNVQISFGEWVRDWAGTKVWELTDSLHVGARIADLLRQGVRPDRSFDSRLVLDTLLPSALQIIGDDTTRAMKDRVFGDAALADTDLRGAGKLGQVLAEEVTAAVGAKTQQVLASHLAHLVDSEVLAADHAAAAEKQLTQGSSQIVAGLTQTKKQLFARVEA